jgi:hypothetical protein
MVDGPDHVDRETALADGGPDAFSSRTSPTVSGSRKGRGGSREAASQGMDCTLLAHRRPHLESPPVGALAATHTDPN